MHFRLEDKMQNEIRQAEFSQHPPILNEPFSEILNEEGSLKEEIINIHFITNSCEEIGSNNDQVDRVSDNGGIDAPLAEISGNNRPDKPVIQNSLPNDFSESYSAETVQYQTTALHNLLTQENEKVYSKLTTFLSIPTEQYTPDNLQLGVQLYKEVENTCVMVRASAVGVATLWKINEGRFMEKILDIQDKLGGKGREEYADEVFPYKKSTRCMYIRISKIVGVESYTFLGTECLRKVATAIEVTNVDGPDQIKALFDSYGEEYDLSINNQQFKAKLKSILKKVLNSRNNVGLEESSQSQDTTDNSTVLSEPDTDRGNTDTNTYLEESSQEQDATNNSTVFGEADTSTALEESSQEQDTTNNSTVFGHENYDTGYADSSTDLDELNQPQDTTDNVSGFNCLTEILSNKNDKFDDEQSKKRWLNQESVNCILASFIESASGLLKYEPPKEALDLYLFDKAKTCLEKLESYVKGEAIN